MSNKKLGIALLFIAIAIPTVGFAESSAVSSLSAGADSSASSGSPKTEVRKNTKERRREKMSKKKEKNFATRLKISERLPLFPPMRRKAK